MKTFIPVLFALLMLIAGCSKEDPNNPSGADEYMIATVNGNTDQFNATESTVYAQFSSNQSSIVVQGQSGNYRISFTIGNNMFIGPGNYNGVTMGYTVNLTSFANNATVNGQTGYSILDISAYDGEYITGTFEFLGYHQSSSNGILVTEGRFRAKLIN